MVVLIGQNWLQDKAGRPRLFNDNDYVRMECRIGLEEEALMIPTTVEDARLPTKDKVPPNIAKMLEYDAAEIRYTRFDVDVKKLIEIIEEKVPPKAAAVAERKTSPGWTAALGQVLSAFVEGQKQHAAAAASPSPLERSPAGRPATSSLAQTIPGLWQLQIAYPNGMTGQATALFEPSGNFHAEGRSRIASFTIDGTWHADASDQVSLRGHQFDGVQTLPYHAVVGFSEVGANAMVGALNTGERAVWRRMR